MRFVVLALLIAAVFPFLQLYEVVGLTGDTRVNFALKSSVKPDSLIKSSVGELKNGRFQVGRQSENRFSRVPGAGADGRASGREA